SARIGGDGSAGRIKLHVGDVHIAARLAAVERCRFLVYLISDLRSDVVRSLFCPQRSVELRFAVSVVGSDFRGFCLVRAGDAFVPRNQYVLQNGFVVSGVMVLVSAGALLLLRTGFCSCQCQRRSRVATLRAGWVCREQPSQSRSRSDGCPRTGSQHFHLVADLVVRNGFEPASRLIALRGGADVRSLERGA